MCESVKTVYFADRGGTSSLHVGKQDSSLWK